MNRWINKGYVILALSALLGITVPASAQVTTDKGKAEAPAAAGSAAAAAGSAAVAAGSATPAASAPADDEARKARHEKRAKKRAERKEKIKEAKAEIRTKVKERLKGKAMSAALKEELKRHARRLARLERVKDVAEDANDTETVARADKLIATENGRHNKWMANYDEKAAGEKGAAK